MVTFKVKQADITGDGNPVMCYKNLCLRSRLFIPESARMISIVRGALRVLVVYRNYFDIKEHLFY